jgi:endonuclease/exonuclease/phosphatase family metal-dependent hydrolase
MEEAFQVQLVQLHKYLKVIQEDLVEGDLDIPLLFCGDFNAVPESATVELMKTGKIGISHDGLTRKGKWSLGLE